MGKLLTFIITSLITLNGWGASTDWHLRLTNFEAARKILDAQPNRHQVASAIFDVSFYGHELIVPQALDADFYLSPQELYSAHGVSVASLLSLTDFGGSDAVLLKVLNTGIYAADFERGLKEVRRRKVRLVHASLGMRDQAVVDLVNQQAQTEGTIFVLSAGNSAARLGRDLSTQYKGIQAIVVSCVDEDLTIPDFAQLGEAVTILAPCGMNNIPSLGVRYESGRIHDRNGRLIQPNAGATLEIREFGQTSAGAPQVSAAVVDLLSIYPDLTLSQIRKLLRESATLFVEFENKKYPILDRENLLRMAVNEFNGS